MSITLNPCSPSFDQFPSDFAVKLENFSAISLSGPEQSKYLQGQVTCDVNQLTDTKLLHGAHCDAKGKVLSAFRLINRNGAHHLLQNSSSVETSLKELNKFGVFAKVDINQANDLSFAALIGEQTKAIIKQHFGSTPDSLSPVLQVGTSTIVYIAGNSRRYLILDNDENIEKLLTEFSLPVFGDNAWQLFEINEGFPLLNQQAVNEFVPQMLNLDAIHGISFTKGCYLGQETVARMQYLGKNKKHMALIFGNISADDKPLSDITTFTIEKQLGENWRKAGDILAYYVSDNGDCYIQAVINNDLTVGTELRLAEQPSKKLTVMALPYTKD